MGFRLALALAACLAVAAVLTVVLRRGSARAVALGTHTVRGYGVPVPHGWQID